MEPIKKQKDSFSYSEFLNRVKSENPRVYNNIMYQRAKSQQPSSEVLIYNDANNQKQSRTQSIGLSAQDPIGSMVVEGAVLNPAFKLLGKGITTLSKPISSKLSVLSTSNVPKNIRSKKYAERVLNSTGIKSSPNFSYSDLVLKKTKGRPAYYTGELGLNSTQAAHVQNIKKKINRFGGDINPDKLGSSKVWIAADNSFGNSAGWYSDISKANILLRNKEKPNVIRRTQVHEGISHGTDNVIENLKGKPLDYYKSFGELVQNSNSNIKYKNSPQWYEIRATMNELLYSLADKYRKNKNINLYKNIKQLFKDTSDQELMESLRTVNGYGADYYNAYLKNPDIANKVKYMLQALPSGTGLIMSTKNE